ncbi:MAG: hypothetical protein R2718_09525 [Solirubrobacterales bacterium]|nr:hypothetical protein [Solirubrobacterales bacterium]
MTKARNALIALAALLVLGLVAAGPAAAKDRNHDRIPDRWEKRHHLSLKVNQARRDQDRDHLNNRGEFRTGGDPRDADTDDDGIEDGDENAGVISAFDGTTLTIDLAGGGSITGTVDDSTEVKCGRECDHDGDDSGPSDETDSRRDHGGDDPADEDESESDDDSDSEGGDCSAADLAAGVAVHEAEIRVSGGGAVFEEIELAK